MKALVLSGGGSKGSYQIGVWKALKKLHIKIEIITGTSVGALNGALMTQKSYRKALKLWKQMNLKILFGEDLPKNNNLIDLYKMYGNQFLKNGGMDSNLLEKIILKTLNIKKFYHSSINYGLVTYNLTNKKPLQLTKKEIPQEKLIDYLIASASCYPAMKKKEIEGKEYIDGGFVDNLPINLAISMGATEIIAIDLQAPGRKTKPKEKIKITTIKPNNKLTNFLLFDEDGSKKNIKYGYQDTMKKYGKLEGKIYTFKKGELEKNKKQYQKEYKEIMKKILNSQTLINSFKEGIKLTKIEKEKFIDKIFLQTLEDLGKKFDLDNTKIYRIKNFNKQLKKNLHKKIQEKSTNQPTIIPKKTVLDLYEKLQQNKLKEIRKNAIINTKEVLEAAYLYTINK